MAAAVAAAAAAGDDACAHLSSKTARPCARSSAERPAHTAPSDPGGEPGSATPDASARIATQTYSKHSSASGAALVRPRLPSGRRWKSGALARTLAWGTPLTPPRAARRPRRGFPRRRPRRRTPPPPPRRRAATRRVRGSTADPRAPPSPRLDPPRGERRGASRAIEPPSRRTSGDHARPARPARLAAAPWRGRTSWRLRRRTAARRLATSTPARRPRLNPRGSAGPSTPR